MRANHIWAVILLVLSVAIVLDYAIGESNVMDQVSGRLSSDEEPSRSGIIVFRDDDVGPFWSTESAIYITEVFRSRNVSHVLGVVPTSVGGQVLSDDVVLTDYLRSIRDDEHIELALHGYNHEHHEFLDVTYNEALYKVSEGSDLMESVLGVVPVTFTPPYNVYNDNVLRAVENVSSMRVFSAGSEEMSAGNAFKRVNGILRVPVINFFYNWADGRYFTRSEIIDSCERQLEQYGFCGIVLHHHMFVDVSGNMDKDKVQVLIDVINWAKVMEEDGNARIVRLKDVSKGDVS